MHLPVMVVCCRPACRSASLLLFDMLPGSQLLQSVTHFKMQFPACQKGSTLILIVEPNVANPGPALDQVRWAALHATLTGLSSVVGPDRTAFLSTVDGGVPWQLEVDLGKGLGHYGDRSHHHQLADHVGPDAAFVELGPD